MRWPRRLRARIILAIVATSAATLLVATLTLLPPLEHRLERDRLNELRQLARAARLGVAELPDRDLHPGSPAVRRFVVGLRRRIGGEVTLVGADGQVLADTDPDAGRGALTVPLARRADVREGVVRGDAIVRAGALTDGGDHVTLVLRKPLGDTRAAAGAVRRAVPLAAGAGLLTGVVLSALLSAGVLRRLRRLRDDTRALRDQGLDHPVTVEDAGDEVDEVARALEDMRARLVEDEAARQEFLSVASHELRTPLAALQGNLELLTERLAAPAADTEAALARAQTALRQTHRLVTLAGALLDLSRVDAGVELTLQPVELYELADRLREELGDAIRASGRDLEVRAEPPVHALADAAAVLRVLGILVENARTHGAGRIIVAVRTDGADAVVRVHDQGPGLPVDGAEALFQRFVRGPDAQGRAGSGLGLPIARGLAEAMGGSLRAIGAQDGACLELRLEAWSDAESQSPALATSSGSSGAQPG
jgi:signal transduction histidine kinase